MEENFPVMKLRRTEATLSNANRQQEFEGEKKGKSLKKIDYTRGENKSFLLLIGFVFEFEI